MMARWRQLASEALGPRDHVQRKQQSRSEQRITANESRQQTPCIQGSLFFFLPEMHVAFRALVSWSSFRAPFANWVWFAHKYVRSPHEMRLEALSMPGD